MKLLLPVLALSSLIPATSHADTSVLSSPGRIDSTKVKGKILLIAANPTTSKQTGSAVGVWAAELTHPFFEFKNAGYEVEFASPSGGKVEFDAWSDPRHESGYSAHDLVTMGFVNTPSLMKRLENTRKLSTVKASDYAAIMIAGGNSPMYTFPDNKNLSGFVAGFYESGKPTGVMCHGVVILLETRLSNGKLLVDGKTWTGFSNEEEKDVEKAYGQKVQP
ncbi:MAG: type 1 glutamine amidotransferase domain-containing protein, partial [Myxococcota bacterium]